MPDRFPLFRKRTSTRSTTRHGEIISPQSTEPSNAHAAGLISSNFQVGYSAGKNLPVVGERALEENGHASVFKSTVWCGGYCISRVAAGFRYVCSARRSRHQGTPCYPYPRRHRRRRPDVSL